MFFRQLATRSVRGARSYGTRGRPEPAKLAALAETNGNHFKRECALAMGLGIVCAIAWKVSVADPIRSSIDAYYTEYDKRNGL